MTERTPAKSGFNVGYPLFFISLVMSGLVLGYLTEGIHEDGYPFDQQIAGSFGAALIPIVIAALIGVFTFSEKKRLKSGASKLMAPTITYALLWMLAAVGGAYEEDVKKGVHDTPASDLQTMVVAVEYFGLAMALVWALPVIAHWVLPHADRERDTPDEIVS